MSDQRSRDFAQELREIAARLEKEPEATMSVDAPLVDTKNFVGTLAANVDNQALSDATFRQFVRDSLPIVEGAPSFGVGFSEDNGDFTGLWGPCPKVEQALEYARDSPRNRCHTALARPPAE